ncbi:uncharacterized protein P884DRAFT_268073 [Thermothelomyces heterothallicus CBS 202.75]|uniref:uncharacterized protein n=1 Tax=Thermothelomyces heterothallicus CBS 202.75 TaxID=1149848 RepID=UPI003742E1F2
MEFDLCSPDNDPVERRRLQNRLAQRRFRRRKPVKTYDLNLCHLLQLGSHSRLPLMMYIPQPSGFTRSATMPQLHNSNPWPELQETTDKMGPDLGYETVNAPDLLVGNLSNGGPAPPSNILPLAMDHVSQQMLDHEAWSSFLLSRGI